MNGETAVWQLPTAELTFPSDRIDVWRVELDSDGLPEEELRNILADDELDRASRFHFDKDRVHYVRGRAALRILLARYLKLPPREIRFQYSVYGKPEIASPDNSRGLHFNVSNSGGLALIAFGSVGEMGIDIEKIRQMPDLLSIARRFFSAREVQAILALSEHLRHEAFFACWTRKEAFLKATGSGLSYPLSAFSVSVDPHVAAEFWEIDGKVEHARQWVLTDVFPGHGFRGALAYKGASCEVEYCLFDRPWIGTFN